MLVVKSKLYGNYVKLLRYNKVERLLKFSRGFFSELRLNGSIRFVFYSNFLLVFSIKRFIKNYCLVTRRHLGLVRYFRLSRMTFRELASFGNLPGIRKSSW
jgi:ribosomal protein S14